MFKKLMREFCALLICSQLFFIESPLFSDTIFVTNTDGGFGDGSLGAAILTAGDGTIIDCSPIAGQTISLGTALPAIGDNFTSSSSLITILGHGVTIDGGGTHAIISLAQGSLIMTDLTIQNGLSHGGKGGYGFTGGGGGTGGGGALYVHSGSVMTISTVNLNNNLAVGGDGGAGNSTGGSGGGGGGYGGGNGGNAVSAGVSAGSGGGGGGNNGGTNGGRDGAAGIPNVFSNFAGAGGGGETPGLTNARAGGSNTSDSAKTGGQGGEGTVNNGAGAGGGGGSATANSPLPPNGGSGFNGSNAIDASSPGTGVGGAGGYGFGADYTYGAGGGGGGGNGGGAGYGTSGGGGGLHGPGGYGGSLGGGGGASSSTPGETHVGGGGGFGAGGGGGNTGGVDLYGLGGAGGSSTNAPAGGGGGSGLGGAIYIQRGGLLILEDGVSFSNNSTTAGQGGLAAGGGSSGYEGSSLGQDLFIQSGGGLAFHINGTLNLANPIEGAGELFTGTGLLLSGTGTVGLNGVNTYLGDTRIQAGRLNLNGSVSGDIQIEPASMLSGNATVHGTIYNSGTISPGNSIGEIFTTNLILSPTSVYNVEINSAGDSDEIIASGYAQVDGRVVVTPEGTGFTAPIIYTIISTGSGVTGSFTSVTSSIPALMSLIYNPLTVQLSYVNLGSINLTDNALNAAKAFANLPYLPGTDVATVNNALLNLSFNGMEEAYEQMGPGQFSPSTEIQLVDALLVRSTYSKHLQQFCFNRDLCCEPSLNFWCDGITQWQNQKKQYGYRDTTQGATVGFDWSMRQGVLGFALSSTYDSFHLKDFGSKGSIKSYYAGVYGRWDKDRFYVNTALLGAFSKTMNVRHLDFETVDRKAYSKHHGKAWLTHLGFGYRLCSSYVEWNPYIDLDYVSQHENSFAEGGAYSLDLRVDAKKSTLFQGEAGVAMSTVHQAWNGVLIPMLTLAYINQTSLSGNDYHANFAGSSSAFIGKGGSYEKNLFAPRLAISYEDLCERIKISVYYDAEIGSRYWAQDVGFDLSLCF